MSRLILAVLIVLLCIVGGYYMTMTKTVDTRTAIETGVETAMKTKNLSLEEQALLRVQLAIIDYSTRNAGVPPTTLNDLVPAYFDALPKNPLTNKPFEYAREGASYRLGGASAPKNGAASAAQVKPGEELPAAAKAGAQGDYVNPNTMQLEAFSYDPTGKRDPFQPFDFSARPVSHAATPLERYSIGQLRLTAVLADASGNRTAIVEDASGKGYTVRPGTKIGTQNGVIVSIDAEALKILETETDFTGKESQHVVEMKIQTGGSTTSSGASSSRARR